MPIRLTRQLVHLMSPVGTAGLFRATMIDTMTALRENSDLLLSTMDVFIKEPLMEWTVNSSSTNTTLYYHSRFAGTCTQSKQTSFTDWYVLLNRKNPMFYLYFFQKPILSVRTIPMRKIVFVVHD